MSDKPTQTAPDYDKPEYRAAITGQKDVPPIGMERPATTPEELWKVLRDVIDEADGDLQYHGSKNTKPGCHTCDLVNKAEEVLTRWRKDHPDA